MGRPLWIGAFRMSSYIYMVGGLLNAGLTTETEQEILNECGSEGWKLVQVLTKKLNGCEYTYFYFMRKKSDEPNPRFDFGFHSVTLTPNVES